MDYKLPNGEKVEIINTPNNKYKAVTYLGPIEYRILEGAPTLDNVIQYLKNYKGLSDITCPKILRSMFRKYLEQHYKFEVATAAILEFEDLTDKKQIAKDIYDFHKAMNKHFVNPYLDETYYPYGVTVRMSQVREVMNNLLR